MKLNIIKISTIVASLTVFIISLTKYAIIIDHQGITAVPSLDYFIMGSTAFMGGAILEQIIWFANPLSLLAIFLLAFGNRNALIPAVFAWGLALSFSGWHRILAAESGAMAKIISFESGYYLWLSSISILMLGTFIYFKVEDKTLNKVDSLLQKDSPKL